MSSSNERKSLVPGTPAPPAIVHHGTIAFDFATGAYSKAFGTDGWKVRPIDWPGFPTPSPPRLGQVLIEFDNALDGPYTVLVSPSRTPDAPMLCCNWGQATSISFEVILFNPVALLS